MQIVTVREGDTLWSLAEKHLGDGWDWPEIYAKSEPRIKAAQAFGDRRARLMTGPRWIFPGTKLVIPDRR